MGSLCLTSGVTHAANKVIKQGGVDIRYNLKLNPAEQAKFLEEMRSILSSIQHIMIGIGSSDRTMIAEYARHSGNTMARATHASIWAKTLPAFQEIGGPTHLILEELAIRAESYDMGIIATDTGSLINQCMACHAALKVR